MWVRGGFPRSFLAVSDTVSSEWREAFIRTFVERDIPQLGANISSETLFQFWTMVAHYHAQLWNGAELARAFGVAATTVRRYLDLLTSVLVLRQIGPWFENLGKRQLRSPKVYVADPGILHALLGIETLHDLQGHPKVGASWEGFVPGELISRFELHRNEMFSWATHSGAELDLLVIRHGKRIGFEVKRTVAPTITRSMRIAFEDLHLDHLCLLHAGKDTFPLAEKIQAASIGSLGTIEL